MHRTAVDDANVESANLICRWYFAFWPRWSTETIAKIAFVPDYTIIVQHWGFMVGMMGALMIVAAFRAEWRTPILISSALEKCFLVSTVLANASRPYADGFWPGATMDATVVLYTIAYFAVCGFETPISVRSRRPA